MSDDAPAHPADEVTDDRIEGLPPGRIISSEAALTAANPKVAFKQSPEGEWHADRARHELKVQTEARRQEEQARQAEFDRQQKAKDNDQRRRRDEVGFYTIVGVPLLVLLVSIGFVLWSGDTETKTWARSLVTLIVGGILGGLTGYIGGKSSK